MAITLLRFKDKLSNWSLNEASFSDFNLLVGVSGVGKTKIINTINAICLAAKGESSLVRCCDWEIQLTTSEGNYVWFGQTWPPGSALNVINQFHDASMSANSRFYREEILKDGKKIVSRYHEFRFLGETLPRLNENESAVSLLKETEEITPLYNALRKIRYSESLNYSPTIDDGDMESFPYLTALQWVPHFTNLDRLKEAEGMPIILKAFLFQENFPQEFDKLKVVFQDIFPTILDIKLDRMEAIDPEFCKRNPGSEEHLVFGVKEKAVLGWIRGNKLSAGMIKTFIQIFESHLLEEGSTLLIDELENSLGVNCLPPIVDNFLRRSDLQFIITSHHPYIINNIPMRYWKLVTRKGSTVTVKDASSIRGLDPDSLLSGFVQLTNLEEYEEAIR